MTKAAQKQKGLGKGLSALMSEDYSKHANAAPKSESSEASSGEGGVQSLPIESVHSGKFQPRTHFDDTYLSELAESIKANGIMQPIIVRPSPSTKGSYEIIAGERRWRASKLAELNYVPVIIRDIEDKQALELALVENIQRQDLSALEEAKGYQRLMDEFAYTQNALAKTVGKSRSHIANLLRLLTLPDELKEMIDTGALSMGHARALLGAEQPLELAREVVRRGLNVRQTENLAKHGIDNFETKPRENNKKSNRAGGYSSYQGDKDPDIIALESTLSDNLGLKVSINDRGNSGDITLHYSSLAQLDDILRRLGGSAI